jgi:hypothetical protein
MLVAGTYAWVSAKQQAKNVFSGGGNNPGGRLHDDFDGKRNKDVYVENFGKQSLFVRIRMDEYMKIAGTSLVSSSKENDVTTWITHKPDTNPETCAQPFHDYWSWIMGGKAGERYYKPTQNTDKNSDSAELGERFWTAEDSVRYPDLGLKEIPQSTVMLMEKWKETKLPGEYWVYDKDGWAYWAMALAPSSATGLLLNEANLYNEPEDEYYYGINVLLHMATKSDISLIGEEGGISDDAKDLLDVISGGGNNDGGNNDGGNNGASNGCNTGEPGKIGVIELGGVAIIPYWERVSGAVYYKMDAKDTFSGTTRTFTVNQDAPDPHYNQMYNWQQYCGIQLSVGGASSFSVYAGRAHEFTVTAYGANGVVLSSDAVTWGP